jgi:hypothetical protein
VSLSRAGHGQLFRGQPTRRHMHRPQGPTAHAGNNDSRRPAARTLRAISQPAVTPLICGPQSPSVLASGAVRLGTAVPANARPAVHSGRLGNSCSLTLRISPSPHTEPAHLSFPLFGVGSLRVFASPCPLFLFLFPFPCAPESCSRLTTFLAACLALDHPFAWPSRRRLPASPTAPQDFASPIHIP